MKILLLLSALAAAPSFACDSTAPLSHCVDGDYGLLSNNRNPYGANGTNAPAPGRHACQLADGGVNWVVLYVDGSPREQGFRGKMADRLVSLTSLGYCAN